MASNSRTAPLSAADAIPSFTNPGLLLEQHPELQIARDEYNINVTVNFGEALTPEETWEQIRHHPGAGLPAHLYFHVPLCSYVCHFCNYVKRLAPRGEALDAALDRWTDLLVNESRFYLDAVRWLPEARIESLFLGGGTASLLRPRHLQRIMRHVQSHYRIAPGCESTLEGNPDNFQNGEIAAAVDLGFNRFSVGVQSLDSRVNRFAGRGHDREMSLRAIAKLTATGLPYNVDIMFGLPHQTEQSVAGDVRTLIDEGVPTITIYRLRNVERHKMGIGNPAAWNVPKVRDRIVAEGLFPTLDETYAMRAAIVDVLLDAGYRPSPCGWWSAPGTYRDGNIPGVSRNKWQNYDTMIAYGPGAYGWLSGDRDDPVQTHNIADIAAYARHMEQSDAPPLAAGRHLRGRQAVATALGFAFKANQPIEVERFKRIYGVDLLVDEPYRKVLTTLVDQGLLAPAADGAFGPTLDGETLHEEIISIYIHEAIGGHAQPVCHR